MNFLDKILGEKEKSEDFFTRNRNKKILATTTLPTEEEVKQEGTEKE